MNLAEHPAVRHFHESPGERPGPTEPPKPLDEVWLRQLCQECGADDAGLVEISRPGLDDQRTDIIHFVPPAKTLLSFVCRMNRGPIRSPARSASKMQQGEPVRPAPGAALRERRGNDLCGFR
jgi:hypothetical protein